NQLYAQQISGTVKNENGEGLNAVTIGLLRAEDSSVVKYEVSKESGVFSFKAVEAGAYFLKASITGYTPVFSALITVTDKPVTLSLSLAKQAEELAAVTVTATRPMIEVKADKMVVN